MVVGFTTTCAISAYHHKSCEFEPRSWRGVVPDTTLCDEVCQKTDNHGIAEMLLKVALNTIIHKMYKISHEVLSHILSYLKDNIYMYIMS